jgi:hypothetical protein
MILGCPSGATSQGARGGGCGMADDRRRVVGCCRRTRRRRVVARGESESKTATPDMWQTVTVSRHNCFTAFWEKVRLGIFDAYETEKRAYAVVITLLIQA